MQTPDLSKTHELLTDSIVPLEDKRKFMLSKEKIQFFHDNGYLPPYRVLTVDQCDKLLKELEPRMTEDHPGRSLWHEFHVNETGDPNNVLFHALGLWRISPVFHDLLWHPGITVPAAQLLSDPPCAIRLWHDQVFAKPPHQGGCVAWHQDYSYWTRTTPMAHLTIHVALDDQTVSNGCLHYIPTSHKWSLLPITSRHFNDMESIKKVLTPQQLTQFVPTPMLLKKGEAVIHHALMVHGSWENKSRGARRATVVNVFADGTQSNTDESLLAGIPPFKPGAKLEGQFFPVLLSPEEAGQLGG